MPKPRSQLISLQDTPWVHCVSRCVRRSYLTGYDVETGIDYSHRRGWIESRLELLVGAFSIDVAAYAILSNHHHVVVRVDQDKAKSWTWQQVIEQWHKVYTGSFLSQRFTREGTLPAAELNILKAQTDTWRERLISVSWFMRALNEPIARWANAEDNVTGHFYEGRFKSQSLLDEQAIIACAVYVDLNPIRAQLAQTPETSEYTSIKKRIEALKDGTTPLTLMPFTGGEHKAKANNSIPFALKDYLELVETTGQIARHDKRGKIDIKLPPILKRLNIDTDTWTDIALNFETAYGAWASSEAPRKRPRVRAGSG